jgi:hypothetical protein
VNETSTFYILKNMEMCTSGATLELRDSGRFEHKGCVGGLKDIDPEFSLSLSFLNINKILQTL